MKMNRKKKLKIRNNNKINKKDYNIIKTKFCN